MAHDRFLEFEVAFPNSHRSDRHFQPFIFGVQIGGNYQDEEILFRLVGYVDIIGNYAVYRTNRVYNIGANSQLRLSGRLLTRCGKEMAFYGRPTKVIDFRNPKRVRFVFQ